MTTVSEATLADIDDNRIRCASVVRQRTPETSGAGRRNSSAEFINISRCDTTRRNHIVASQFRGLVIPSPTVVTSSDAVKLSSSLLPTIARKKPPTEVLLPPSAQQRRGSASYQSVLSGLPFVTSTSRSNAFATTSGVLRRSSVYGYPQMQHTSNSSVSVSQLEPSGMCRHVNHTSSDICDDKLYKAKTQTAIDSTKVPSLMSSKIQSPMQSK